MVRQGKNNNKKLEQGFKTIDEMNVLCYNFNIAICYVIIQPALQKPYVWRECGTVRIYKGE